MIFGARPWSPTPTAAGRWRDGERGEAVHQGLGGKRRKHGGELSARGLQIRLLLQEGDHLGIDGFGQRVLSISGQQRGQVGQAVLTAGHQLGEAGRGGRRRLVVGGLLRNRGLERGATVSTDNPAAEAVSSRKPIVAGIDFPSSNCRKLRPFGRPRLARGAPSSSATTRSVLTWMTVVEAPCMSNAPRRFDSAPLPDSGYPRPWTLHYWDSGRATARLRGR